MPNLQSLISNLTSGNDQLAEASVTEIAALGESALPALFALLDSPDPDKRWWSLRTLCLIPHPQVLSRLRNALHDADPAIRQCTALGLSQQPDIDSIPDLLVALNDTDRLVARLAGDALIAIGGPVVTALIATLENGSQAAQIEAVRALVAIGDTRAIPAMFAAWDGGSTLIQHWVEQGFEKMGVGMQFFVPK
jgi:HEAT repeat protein